MSLLGLDVGTTGCKAVVFDVEGNVLSSAYREYPLLHPQSGWAELDPNQVWTKIEESIQEVANQVKADPIKALSISTQGEAFAPVDRAGRLLTNTAISFDIRGEEFTRWWDLKLGSKKIMEITGMPLHSMFSINRVMWLKKYHPDIYRRTWKFLCYEDLVIQKLGLPPTIDYSLAARTMAFDIVKKRWSREILSLAEVDESLLSEVRPSGTEVGRISSKVCSRLSLPSGVSVVTGGHDQPCGSLGAGVKEEELATEAAGTVDCIATVFKEPHLDQKMLENNFACYPHTISQFYISLAFNFTGGCLLRWFRDALGGEEKREAEKTGENVYSILINKATKEPSPLYLLPHFTTTGTPYMDPNSAGAILGLSLNTSKADLIKAILEGVAFEMKHNLVLLEEAGIPVRELRAIGGGAKSKKWLQLKADIYNRPLVSLKVSEAACLGAAILAGVGIGEYSSIEEAVETVVKKRESFYPHKEKAKIYEEKFAVYKDIYPTLKELNHQIRDLSAHRVN